MDVTQYPIKPKIVAVAHADYLHATHPFPDSGLPADAAQTPPKYGQDFTYEMNRTLPTGSSVGSSAADLKPRMEALLGVFAKGDRTGMARSLFDKYLARQTTPI